ncbi:flavin reductase [Ekhidna sp.]|uniref:flavin reductase n=1 Tax=Ekhidna sp. TaxID=2608089 RepID=UPI0032980C1E
MGVKRPWNIVNVPVYSLATYDRGQVNMNICTYVTAVSMKPKLFMVAIDYSTKTYENLKNGSQSVLQVLHQDHKQLINSLGKKSGKSFNKLEFLQKKNLIDDWNENNVLKGACGYLELKKMGHKNIDGDHELFWFKVTKSSTKSEKEILMFQDLIEEGIIL